MIDLFAFFLILCPKEHYNLCLHEKPICSLSSNYFFSLWIVIYSVFGEDALVNVSVEKKEDNDGKLAGYIRIRSKTQGIALSLGDRITSVQRSTSDKWVDCNKIHD